MRLRVVSYILALSLLLAVPAKAGCYACTVLDSGDLACESKSSGKTNCKTWANRESIGCETSGESCGGGGREAENIVQNERCLQHRQFLLVYAETGRATTAPRVSLVAVGLTAPDL